MHRHKHAVTYRLCSDFPLVVDDANGHGTCTGTGLAYVLIFLVVMRMGRAQVQPLQDQNSLLALRFGIPMVDANG